MRSRLLIAAAAVAAGIFSIATPAMAETRVPGSDAFVAEDDSPTVIVTDGGGSGGGGGESAAPDPCTWQVAVADDFAMKVYDVDGSVQYSSTGRWLQKVCPGLGAVVVDGRTLIPDGGLVDVEALALQARASIGIVGPAIRTSPEAGGRLYVQVPTWLWIEGGWWRTYDATASTGRVTATVTARPVRTSWSLGDGTVTTCTGPGVAWRPGLAEDATNCAHTYTTSSAASADGTFPLTATVELEISWTSNIGQGGTLPAIDRSSTRAVDVGEIQAVGTAR